MSEKRKMKPVKQKKAMSREEQLEHENELLRLEIAYLKKLKAFEENPDAYLEKHKQRWHSNSKEEGFKLKHVLGVVGVPEATYHYHVQQLKKEDSDKYLKEIIMELFEKHEGKYGYRRIYLEFKGQGYKINHKKYNEL